LPVLCIPLLLSGAALAAEEQETDDRVTLRIAVPDPNITAVYQRSQRVVFDKFVELNPDINIVPNEILQMEQMGNSAGLLAIAGGVSPDVFSLYYQAMHTYISQGFLAPIEDYIESWHMYDEVPPQLWPVATGEDGKRYGAIYTWPTVYLVYRKDLFEEVGLDPNRPPQNWDELYEYARRLSDPDMIVETATDPRGGFGRMGMFMQTSGSWIFSNFVWQGGGDLVHKREDGKWEAVFDSPGGVAALEYYQRLRWTRWSRCHSGRCAGKNVSFDVTPEMFEAGIAECPVCGQKYVIDEGRERMSLTRPDGTPGEEVKIYTGVLRTGFGGVNATYQRTFGRGEVAMMISPFLTLQNVLEQNIVRVESIGISPLPAGPAGRASIVDGDVYVIASAIKDDKRKMDAAWRYVEFMTSDLAHEIETRVYVESGYGRFVRNPHWLEQFGYDDYYAEIDPFHLAAFDEGLKYGRPEPFCPGYAAMGVEMNTPVSRVLRIEDVDAQAELETIVKRINTHFFKLYPEAEMRRKRWAGAGIAVLVVTALCIAGYMIVRSLQERVAATKSGLSVALRASPYKHFYAWLFLLPAVGTVFFWRYLPLISGSLMSFYDWKIMGAKTFIFLDNFIEAFGQPLFWKALYNTLFYTSLTMTFGFAAPIILALFLSEVPRLKITFRMLFYLPALTSALVLMFLWRNLFFNPSDFGILNQIIGWFGIAPKMWLQDPRLAMFCIVGPGIWAGAGPGSIIYLAALKTVPDELYEAAEMDGAGPFQKIRLVTLPYLKALIIINFLGAFIGSFHATQNIFVMTMGGPENATRTLGLEIWFNAFLFLKFGYATAMAWILGSMLIGFTLYQLRIFQRVQFTAGAAREAAA
jgi:multiple sugar transport system permease protein